MQSMISETILSAIITALAAFGAAFGGAWYAFVLEERAHLLRKRSEEQERLRRKQSDEVAFGNRAMFILMQQWNGLRLIQTQFIDSIRSNDLRFIGMQPSFPLWIMNDGCLMLAV